MSDTGVIVTVSPRDYDAVLLARGGGTWSVEQTAIANCIEVNRRLEAGWPVKVPVRVIYRPCSDGSAGVSHMRGVVQACAVSIDTVRNRTPQRAESPVASRLHP